MLWTTSVNNGATATALVCRHPPPAVFAGNWWKGVEGIRWVFSVLWLWDSVNQSAVSTVTHLIKAVCVFWLYWSPNAAAAAPRPPRVHLGPTRHCLEWGRRCRDVYGGALKFTDGFTAGSVRLAWNNKHRSLKLLGYTTNTSHHHGDSFFFPSTQFCCLNLIMTGRRTQDAAPHRTTEDTQVWQFCEKVALSSPRR